MVGGAPVGQHGQERRRVRRGSVAGRYGGGAVVRKRRVCWRGRSVVRHEDAPIDRGDTAHARSSTTTKDETSSVMAEARPCATIIRGELSKDGIRETNARIHRGT